MMDAKIAQRPQFSAWIDSDKVGRKSSSSLRVPQKLREGRCRVLISAHLQPTRSSNRHKSISLEVPCSYREFPGAPRLQSGSFNSPFDEALILQNKSQEIEPYLSGRCIYLVGMMGSGKTTVGKILSQVLGYNFCDSDKLVEEDVGTSVADIFKLYGEGFFREKETEMLKRLSRMHQMVVSTGGGAVIRPVNWRYMQHGISVWLDVPLEALAQRIAAVGTNSRPLLHDESGDAYTKALTRLSTLLEERSESYAYANARVSLEEIAAKLGYRDVSYISPTAIAIEALERIECFLREEDGMAFGTL
ncbi:shikimate kinase, chloroplastic isoform X1 [Rhodamnia argentea]|uniref:shikimate kinase n=1 Tax=Rhodamnia argentea TaxID=178133 RepID=A0A8B8PJJ7_9MYRT|nr:shikimate kinase, chloroplastic isoform X1 [Rhodamnia argentea]XP_030534970.1 shikimate kinase, chloroplastic isoform X1 [Rhodamnia argentea]